MIEALLNNVAIVVLLIGQVLSVFGVFLKVNDRMTKMETSLQHVAASVDKQDDMLNIILNSMITNNVIDRRKN